MEPELATLLMAILQVLGPGAILDAGANDGTDTAILADAAKPRRVVAVEPLRGWQPKLEGLAHERPNRVVVHGGLGDSAGVGSYGVNAEPSKIARTKNGMISRWPRGQTGLLGSYVRRERGQPRVNFTIHTIDALFSTQQLALAHLDLEGGELGAVRGANATFTRDRPVVTLETYPKLLRTSYVDLVQTMRSLRYTVYEIRESCGMAGACRNVLCVPDDAPLAVSSVVRAQMRRYCGGRNACLRLIDDV